MRLAKISRTLLLMALPPVLMTCALAQDHPNVQPSSVSDQLNQAPAASQAPPAASNPAKAPLPASAKAPAQQPAKGNTPPKPVTPGTAAKPPVAPNAAAKTASQQNTKPKAPLPASAKATAQQPAKGNTPPKPATPGTPAKTADVSKAATKPEAQKTTKAPVERPAQEKGLVSHRDPFDVLLNSARAGNATPENLPPGKAGLVVSTLHLDGLVRGPGGMIAVVSNPQQRVYFLRDGDKLYDGSVEHITLEDVSFQEIGKDAFGKPIDRQVTRRLYPRPGELQ
jgi:hypothetical protein